MRAAWTRQRARVAGITERPTISVAHAAAAGGGGGGNNHAAHVSRVRRAVAARRQTAHAPGGRVPARVRASPSLMSVA